MTGRCSKDANVYKILQNKGSVVVLKSCEDLLLSLESVLWKCLTFLLLMEAQLSAVRVRVKRPVLKDEPFLHMWHPSPDRCYRRQFSPMLSPSCSLCLVPEALPEFLKQREDVLFELADKAAEAVRIMFGQAHMSCCTCSSAAKGDPVRTSWLSVSSCTKTKKKKNF